MIEQRYGKADLHVHTMARDGLITPEDCIGLAQEAGLDVLAITDHDMVEGAWEALRKAQEKNLPPWRYRRGRNYHNSRTSFRPFPLSRKNSHVSYFI